MKQQGGDGRHSEIEGRGLSSPGRDDPTGMEESFLERRTGRYEHKQTT